MTSIRISIVQNLFEQLKFKIMALQLHMVLTKNLSSTVASADELLSLEGIEASYVVAKREDNLIGISARSLGSINVQLTMEALGGGGHLTNAATQLKGLSIEEAIEQLQQAITEQMSRSEDA